MKPVLARFSAMLLALALAAPLGCAEATRTGEVQTISQAEVMDAGGAAEGQILLDVRTPGEFASGHVPAARNIPLGELASRIGELEAYRKREVVVYCERGGRARKAAGVLQRAGFSKLGHLEGDMSAWRDAGLPVERGTAEADRARAILGTLPSQADSPGNPITPAKVDLGRMLFFDTRLSRNHDVACNSCHDLARYGQDGRPTSPGHRGQRGGRNSPSVYNAAFHVAQFWDGRAADVEEQAKGPILNPIEMAMPSEAAVLAVLRSIPGYAGAFVQAFPGEKDPITYDNLGRAIGAFERKLVTPSRFDAFMDGKTDAISADELAGFDAFVSAGCPSCHLGPVVGGTLYRKLGLVVPYETDDPGRFAVTGKESDRRVFKVPSLRNVAETAPYFHDGSVPTLEEAIRLMGRHQLGRTLTDAQVKSIATFLGSLTGEIDASYTAKPVLAASGPNTPAPDPR